MQGYATIQIENQKGQQHNGASTRGAKVKTSQKKIFKKVLTSMRRYAKIKKKQGSGRASRARGKGAKEMRYTNEVLELAKCMAAKT